MCLVICGLQNARRGAAGSSSGSSSSSSTVVVAAEAWTAPAEGWGPCVCAAYTRLVSSCQVVEGQIVGSTLGKGVGTCEIWNVRKGEGGASNRSSSSSRGMKSTHTHIHTNTHLLMP